MIQHSHWTAFLYRSTKDLDAHATACFDRTRHLDEQGQSLALENHRRLVQAILNVKSVRQDTMAAAGELRDAREVQSRIDVACQHALQASAQAAETKKLTDALTSELTQVERDLLLNDLLSLHIQDGNWKDAVRLLKEVQSLRAQLPEGSQLARKCDERTLSALSLAAKRLLEDITSESRENDQVLSDLGTSALFINALKKLSSAESRSEIAARLCELVRDDAEDLARIFFGCFDYVMDSLVVAAERELKFACDPSRQPLDALRSILKMSEAMIGRASAIFPSEKSGSFICSVQRVALSCERILQAFFSAVQDSTDEVRWTEELPFLLANDRAHYADLLRLQSVEQSSSSSVVTPEVLAKIAAVIVEIARQLKMQSTAVELLLDPVLEGVQDLISRRLKSIAAHFASDIKRHFDPQSHSYWKKRAGGQTLPKLVSTSKDENILRLVAAQEQLQPCQPLALWMNSHFELLNDLRVLQCPVLQKHIGRWILNGDFQALRFLLVVYGKETGHVVREQRKLDPAPREELLYLSKLIESQVVPSILLAESLMAGDFATPQPQRDICLQYLMRHCLFAHDADQALTSMQTVFM